MWNLSYRIDITIQRIERINPKLNAIIHKIYDQAREIAEGQGSEIKADKANWLTY